MKLTLIILLLLVPFVRAEDQVQHLRLMTLGSLPIWGSGNSIPLPLGNEKFDVLPPEISLVSGDSLIPMKLAMRSFTGLVSIKPGVKELVFKKGRTFNSPEWFSVPKPVAPLSLGVLFRERGKTWDHPRILLLKDDAESFPVGKIRFVNVSDKVIIVRMSGGKSKPFGIAPGGSSIRSVEEGLNEIEVGYQDVVGSSKLIWKNTIKVGVAERAQCFLFNAEPENSKTEATFLYFAEAVPKFPIQLKR